MSWFWPSHWKIWSNWCLKLKKKWPVFGRITILKNFTHMLYCEILWLNRIFLSLIYCYIIFIYVLGPGILSADGYGMGKMTHGQDGSIEEKVWLNRRGWSNRRGRQYNRVKSSQWVIYWRANEPVIETCEKDMSQGKLLWQREWIWKWLWNEGIDWCKGWKQVNKFIGES